MSFRVPKNTNDSGASPSHTAPQLGTSRRPNLEEGEASGLPPPASVIPDDLHLIHRMLLEQTRRGFEVSSSLLRTFRRAEAVAGRSVETAEAIATATRCLEVHWETYVDLMAMIFGKVHAADDSRDREDAGPAPPS